MTKILNPFESLSIGKALSWGLIGTSLSALLVFIARTPGEFDVMEIFSLLSTNFVLWLALSTMLYLSALLFSPSRIRALDIFATNLFALLPNTVMYGVSSLLFGWIQGSNPDPQSVAGLAVYGSYYLLLLASSITLVWSMVWGCLAYLVSANVKGGRGIAIFVVCFALVNLVIQLVITYFSL